jgi:FlaA1/EpsC-like NDP-sugar epimerase
MLTKIEMRLDIQKLAIEANAYRGGVDLSMLASRIDEYPHLIIYGAGALGRLVLNFIESICKCSVKVKCFLDRNAVSKPNHLGYPVYKPDDMHLCDDLRKTALVIFALGLNDFEYDELQEQLYALGYRNFLNAIYYYKDLMIFSG